MKSQSRVSVVEIRKPDWGEAVCMDLGQYTEKVNEQGVILLNPTMLFPVGYDGSRSVRGINVAVVITHLADIETSGCVKGDTWVRQVDVATVQACNEEPSQRCANCVLRLLGGIDMQSKAMDLSRPKT